MGRVIKIVAWGAVALVAVLAIALVVAASMFDPNDYRDRIAAEVEKQTGRSFAIEGDLSLRVFPWLAVGVGGVTLGNAEGFGDEPFATLESASVGVRLWPLLLRREVELASVTVDGLRVNLATDAQGRDNWSDLAGAAEDAADASADEEPVVPAEDGAGELPIRSLEVAGIDIRKASLRYTDGATGAVHYLEQLDVSTGRIRLGEPVTLKLFARYLGLEAGSDDPTLSAEIDFGAIMDADLETQQVELEQIALNLTARGDAIPAGSQQLKLGGRLKYDGAAGTLNFANGSLQAAGITADLSAEGRNLNDTPAFNGTLSARRIDLRQLAKALDIELPQTSDDKVLRNAELELRFTAGTTSASVPELRAKLDDTTLTGRLAVENFSTQRISFELNVDEIDIDRYMPPEVAEATKPASETSDTDINSIRIPAELLDAVNARGTFSIARLKVQGLRLTDVKLEVDALKDRPKSQTLTAKLYGGDIQLTSRLTPGNPPSYATQFRVSSVRAGDLLKDFLDMDLASGTANLSVDLSSRGETVGDIRKALSGDVSVALRNGAIKGFNIAQSLRKAQATLTGQTMAETEPMQTDFAELTATAKITNGILRSDDLDGRNPLLRLLGTGAVDLVDERIDYLARPTIVGTLAGQEGAARTDLRGLEVPIRISGSWADPSVRIDLRAALEQQAAGRLREAASEQEERLKAELREREREARARLEESETVRELRRDVEERLGGDAGEALRGLFGSSRSRSQQQQPPAEEQQGNGN